MIVTAPRLNRDQWQHPVTLAPAYKTHQVIYFSPCFTDAEGRLKKSKGPAKRGYVDSGSEIEVLGGLNDDDVAGSPPTTKKKGKSRAKVKPVRVHMFANPDD